MAPCLRSSTRLGYLRVLILSFLLTSCALAQEVALSVSSGSGSPGGTVNLSITQSGTGSTTAAVQWTLGYSPVDFTSATVSVGPAGTAAGKQLFCSSTAGTSTCVLWGVNANALSDGVVATVALTLSASTVNTSSSIQLTNGVAAALDGTAIAASTTGNTVSITQPLFTWSISGTISPSAGGSGATVTLSGAANATTTADGSGNYTFAGLANGAYIVTPSKSGYTFSPASQAVTISGANLSAVNFTAVPVTWSISGREWNDGDARAPLRPGVPETTPCGIGKAPMSSHPAKGGYP